MKITPQEIQQRQFQIRWKGYNPEEVTTFLDMVSSEMEALVRENSAFKEALKKSEAAIDDYRERDKALKDTLIMAQKMTEDIKAGALKEAEIVLGEARLQSEQIVAGAHNRLSQLLDEIHELIGQRAQLLASLRATIDTHAKLLDITEKQSERRESGEDRFSLVKTSRVHGERPR